MAQDPITQDILALLREQDPEIADLIALESKRQDETLELIASENHASLPVMHTMGTCLTNKYAEGYPGARYYGGCQFHDQIETLAIERAKQLFGCNFANVQPHSGAQANTAVFMALMQPGDTFASLRLADGGHLSHGMKINFSGVFYNPVHYPLVTNPDSPDFETLDYDAIRDLCLEHKPKLILCGYSAYPRTIDFARFRDIADEVGALLHADIAHISGLVAAGVHPSPFPYADVVTTTTHKTLRGPRGGLILTNNEDLAKKFNKAVFPGVQGGPLMHVIASKAVAFAEALTPDFKAYSKRTVDNARALARALIDLGYRITSGGTDNHLMLVDLQPKSADLTGHDAEEWLGHANIVVNKNGVPNDPRPPRVTSGLRLGTPALTTRGMNTDDMVTVARLIDRVLTARGDEQTTNAVRQDVIDLCARYPIHPPHPVPQTA